ncbi:MAG: hypothetical protein OEY44_04920 [Candidatus Peregrinibacteria bacterium]|nr:hypothetical protein [Candidatus Peregrinibacteria bacterium]
MSEKERLATLQGWEKFFADQEGISISRVTIKARLLDAGVVGTTGINRRGHLQRNGFFYESDVRKCCADLLGGIPQVNEEGLIVKDGREYASINRLCALLNISDKSIERRMRDKPVATTEGRLSNGNVITFYSVEDVRGLCQDLTKELPVINNDGLAFIGGETYGTVIGLSAQLGVSDKTIAAKIRQGSPRAIKGRLGSGNIVLCYSEKDLRLLCKDHMRDLPRAEKAGWIEIDGKIFGTAYELSKRHKISQEKIKAEFANEPYERKARDRLGRLRSFYQEEAVLSYVAHSEVDRPSSGADGYLEVNSRKYVSIAALANLLEVSVSFVSKKIKKSGIQGLNGRNARGNPCVFYLVEEVRNIFHVEG